VTEREAGLEARERGLLTRVEPAPQPVAALEPVGAVRGGWKLDELERLVQERRRRLPERAEEWDTYLFLLRDHADADGSLPPSFDSLVNDVFGDVLRF
jgi:hypothetical protein